MDYRDLFLLSNAQVRGALTVKSTDPLPDSSLLRAESAVTLPLVFKHSMGGTPKDLIPTGYPAVKLLSDRVFEILRREQVSGWTTFPVVVHGQDGIVTGYQGLAVTGRCGPINKSLSGEVWRDPPSPLGRRRLVRMGLYFHPETWDGSDVFVPQNADYVFVVARVKHMLEKAKVRNIMFERLTEVENLLP